MSQLLASFPLKFLIEQIAYLRGLLHDVTMEINQNTSRRRYLRAGVVFIQKQIDLHVEEVVRRNPSTLV